MQNLKNPKEKKIIIEAELMIPLEELPMIALAEDVDVLPIMDTLLEDPGKINRLVKGAMEKEISEENPDVKIKRMKFSETDSGNIHHATAYFRTRLEGTEKVLKKIAGEDKLFFYDWGEDDSETKN